MNPENLACWANQLKDMHPQLPVGVIDQVLRQYADHPDIFNTVCEEHKQTPFEPQTRSTRTVYDTTYSGNDIPWGDNPPNQESCE